VRCLVTGATGYIGGRLAPRLIEAGHAVRALTRDASRLRDAAWARHSEVVEGDVLDPVAARRALDGIDVAYFLVHSLGSADFEAKDRAAARTFAAAAAAAGVRRIVYLGGPAVEGDSSAHLRSRSEVGRLLASTG
jgi:uncharacterized protein YbjT (DUF2867 family)